MRQFIREARNARRSREDNIDKPFSVSPISATASPIVIGLLARLVNVVPRAVHAVNAGLSYRGAHSRLKLPRKHG